MMWYWNRSAGGAIYYKDSWLAMGSLAGPYDMIRDIRQHSKFDHDTLTSNKQNRKKRARVTNRLIEIEAQFKFTVFGVELVALDFSLKRKKGNRFFRDQQQREFKERIFWKSFSFGRISADFWDSVFCATMVTLDVLCPLRNPQHRLSCLTPPLPLPARLAPPSNGLINRYPAYLSLALVSTISLEPSTWFLGRQHRVYFSRPRDPPHRSIRSPYPPRK